MSKITFLEVEAEDAEKISQAFPEAAIHQDKLSEHEIIEKCRETAVLCVFIYTKVTARLIDSLPELKLIVTRSVGYDHIDLEAARKKGVLVCNVPDYGSHVIAEHVFALLLSGLRNVSKGDKQVEKDHTFQFKNLRGRSLKGKRLGLIGTGKIGKNVARIASLGFLMDVCAYDTNPDSDIARENHFTYAALEEVIAKSDIISLHCPLLPSTKHLINDDTIAAMKDGVVIVNTSRGGVIDTKALIRGLKSGKVSQVALDVLEHEKNIENNEDLLHLPNVIITPHIAFYADDSMNKMYEESFASIRRYLNNEEPVHQVLGV